MNTSRLPMPTAMAQLSLDEVQANMPQAGRALQYARQGQERPVEPGRVTARRRAPQPRTENLIFCCALRTARADRRRATSADRAALERFDAAAAMRRAHDAAARARATPAAAGRDNAPARFVIAAGAGPSSSDVPRHARQRARLCAGSRWPAASAVAEARNAATCANGGQPAAARSASAARANPS